MMYKKKRKWYDWFDFVGDMFEAIFLLPIQNFI